MVDGIDDLLKAVGDHLVDGAMLGGEVHHLVRGLPIVGSVFQADEIVEVHEELRCGTSPAEHAGDHEDHVDKSSTEGFEIGRCGGIASNGHGAPDEPGIHGDGCAVVGKGCLVVLIYEMMCEFVEILVGKLFPIHFLDAVGE